MGVDKGPSIGVDIPIAYSQNPIAWTEAAIPYFRIKAKMEQDQFESQNALRFPHVLCQCGRVKRGLYPLRKIGAPAMILNALP
jgi:hypothetical protein